MVTIVGHTDRGLLCTHINSRPSSASPSTLTLVEFPIQSQSHPSHPQKVLNTEYTKKYIRFKEPWLSSSTVTHASLQILNRHRHWDEESSTDKTKKKLLLNNNSKSDQNVKNATKPTTATELFYLLAIASKQPKPDTSPEEYEYSASLYLIKETNGLPTSQNSELEVIDQLNILDKKSSGIRVHLLPTFSEKRHSCCADSDENEFDTDTTEEGDESAEIAYRNRAVIMILGECITLYEVESFPHPSNCSGTKIEIQSSEVVVKNFWWAQWLPQQEAVTYAHFRKPRQSSFDDDDCATPPPKPKPILSVLQFHPTFPRESVLNMPLDFNVDLENLGHSEASTEKIVHISGELVSDPNILTSTNSAQLKLLAHSSGVVYLFQLHSQSPESQARTDSTIIKYSVNMLHHNKTLNVHGGIQLNDQLGSQPQPKFDVALYFKHQYVVVIGWPHFIHLLDIGSTHEPSHHLIFDCPTLLGHRSSPFLSLSSLILPSNSSKDFRENEEKVDMSAKSTPIFIFEDFSRVPLDLNSSVLLPLLEKADIRFKLGVIHHFLVHSEDINVAKRIIYDEGKKRGNIHLKQIYQEFLIAHAHLQTKKQILPNMDSFLYLVPYSPNPELDYSVERCIQNPNLQLDLIPNPTDVSTMLLSPSQRVFPHNITDLWTSLWHLNRQYTRSKRFNHRNIAEKLLLSLQCYKPEALSRASTPGPMSPSSPMICTSLGDIAGMFGRRATELQLPFVEHESCTANKQEYIFSINLRELSMHLLKERKEWPLHGHTVAGKYICALGDTARLLCHLLCLTVHLQPTKNRDKGFNLIDTLEWETRLKLFMLMEHYTLALSTLACPLPQGFTPFFAYLGYRVLKYDQFLWHIRSGTFDLQIDIVKTIMADMKDTDPGNVSKKLHLLSLLPKIRANRVLNTWSHPVSVSLRARQHSSDLLSGVVSQNRKRMFTTTDRKKKGQNDNNELKGKSNPLDTFFGLLTAKANASDIDLGLLTEATLISMEENSNSSAHFASWICSSQEKN